MSLLIMDIMDNIDQNNKIINAFDMRLHNIERKINKIQSHIVCDNRGTGRLCENV